MLVLIRATIRIQECLTEFLPLHDVANFKDFAGSAAWAEVCAVRVFLVQILAKPAMRCLM